MPDKADRCGLTDSGRMRDDQRCGPCSKVCGDAASNQAISGSFTSVIAGPEVKHPPAALTRMNGRAACPEWALGHSCVPRAMKTQQRRRQLQAAGEGEGNAGWVSPGGNHTPTQGKGWSPLLSWLRSPLALAGTSVCTKPSSWTGSSHDQARVSSFHSWQI